jgi:ABC-type branched-subunit amino acid transport system substrate-binding protein
MKNIWILFAIVTLALSGGCSSSNGSGASEQAAKSEDTIRIGLLVSYSGTLVCAGNYWKAAAELAAYEINNSGKLFNKKIEIITEDAESDPAKAIIAAQRLVDAGVKLIIGADLSDSTLNVAKQITIPNNILLISHASTAPDITTLQDNGLVWRLVPSDVAQGRVAANYAYSQLNRRTAGIFFMDTAYGRGLATAFKKEFEKQGGSITASVGYPAMTGNDLALYDFNTMMPDFFATHPEAIYLVSYYLDGAKITQAMKPYFTAAYTPQMIGVDGNYGNVFKGNADTDVINGMVGTKSAMDMDNTNYMKFKTNYEAAFAVTPTLYSETTYDAVYMLVYAMLAADSTEPARVSHYLQSISSGGEVVNVANYSAAKEKILSGADINYNGASGLINLDANGDITDANYDIWQINQGAYVNIAHSTLKNDTVLFESQLSKAIMKIDPESERNTLLRLPKAPVISGTLDFCK